jgi:hypothetical protein
MKNLSLFVIILTMISSLCFSYEVGDTVDDLSWTDSNNEDHSIYELTAQEKVILFFWGDNN